MEQFALDFINTIAITIAFLFIGKFIYKKTIAFFNFVILVLMITVVVLLMNVINKFGTWHTFWTTPVTLLAIILFLKWFNWHVSKPLRYLTEIVRQLSEGNYGVTFDPKTLKKKDEIGVIASELSTMLNQLQQSVKITEFVSQGQLYEARLATQQSNKQGDLNTAIDNMIEKLNGVIRSISTGSDAVALGSMEISSSAQNISHGAGMQAASTEEIQASIEEILSSISSNANNTTKAQKTAQTAAEGIQEGMRASEKSLLAVEKITNKIQIISKIAEKTSMLAVNASIEAARSGQTGKGFSAVASEVRKLAEESTHSANEIILLAEENLEIVRQSKETLTTAAPRVEKTALIINEISNASSEQKSGMQQIQLAISELNSVTVQNTSTAEELATGSEELASQANLLKDAISFFKTEKTEDVDEKINELELEMEQILASIRDLKNKKAEDDSNNNLFSPKTQTPETKKASPRINLTLDEEDKKNFTNYD